MSEIYKNPSQQSDSMLKIQLPSHKPTQQELDDEVRNMFKSRKEGLDYIEKTYPSGWERKNAMSRLDRVYPEVRSWGEDMDRQYASDFFQQSRGNRDGYINHMIERFGVPRGSTRAKELAHYGDEYDILDLMQDMNVGFNFDGLEQYKNNPHAMVVSHPKHYKSVILGARDNYEAKRKFAESILKDLKRKK